MMLVSSTTLNLRALALWTWLTPGVPGGRDLGV